MRKPVSEAEEYKKLKVEIPALSSTSSSSILYSKTISNVEISQNKYVCYKGYLFCVDPKNSHEFTLYTNDEWQYEEHEY